MNVKLGDMFVALPSWDDIGIGEVTRVENKTFEITFENGDERGPFYEWEIGDIIRRLTKLDKALK